MGNLQKALEKWNKIPQITETGPERGANAPLMRAIRKKRRIQYAFLCMLGMLPCFLDLTGAVAVNSRLVRFFMGLVIPGGGFLAHADFIGILTGIAVLLCFFTLGRKVIELYGNLALMLFLWILGCFGGLYGTKPSGIETLLLPVMTAFFCLTYFEVRQWRLEKRILRDREKRTERFEEIIKPVQELSEALEKKREKKEDYRELDGRALKAARYLFDMTVREKGDFTDYDKTSINSMGAYRYQFAAMGYALMLMQCKYTPNFHGYQNQAWRFLIEAFTDPRCCGYWKWEYLGGRFRWNPDPVANENIMLSGWMLPVVTAYGAHTGDYRYEKKGALCFCPSHKPGAKKYSYSAGELTGLLVNQWRSKKYPGILISCEPHIAFPICNSYGILGTIIYDRDHGTNYVEEFLDIYNEAMKKEFVEADGCVADMRHYLFGAMRFMHKPAMNVSPIGGIAIGLEYGPIYPGLAKRCYALVKDEVVTMRRGMAYLKDLSWEQAIDLGTMTKNPSMYCGLLEQLACEYDDRELLEAVEAVERQYLKPSKNPGVLRYKDVAVINMAYLCLSKWAKGGDWYDTIHKGPSKEALKGPILEDCAYPDVLVARAVSTDGTDLELVLSSGSEKKEQTIKLARFMKNQSYMVEGLNRIIQADGEGRMIIQLTLSERTELRIRRV